jgi:hypothetical protein
LEVVECYGNWFCNALFLCESFGKLRLTWCLGCVLFELVVPGGGEEEDEKEEEANDNDGGCKISGFERGG